MQLRIKLEVLVGDSTKQYWVPAQELLESLGEVVKGGGKEYLNQELTNEEVGVCCECNTKGDKMSNVISLEYDNLYCVDCAYEKVERINKELQREVQNYEIYSMFDEQEFVEKEFGNEK